MSKNVAFTICAKNYLAQAITLQTSFKNHNPNADFYIFLADIDDKNELSIEYIPLGIAWIPKWEEMAFKYDVVEFSTGIKPFCINKLFNDGYEKVIYLDPDIYVVDSLDYIFNILDNKSVMFTPHYIHLLENFDGAVNDSSLLGQGVFNMGFGAYKNNAVGRNIINWWMKKLENQCYIDAREGIFCDQKWMNWVPAAHPTECEITHHAGINVAIWNLHERTLLVDNNKYFVKDNYTNEVFPLLFYHFSGFDPFVHGVINRRHPQFSTKRFPSFIPIIEEYRKNIYSNDYDFYHPMKYGFITFTNGENIIPIQRRLYRRLVENGEYFEHPFNVEGNLYKLFEKNKCLTKWISTGITAPAATKEEAGKMESKYLIPAAKLLMRIVGIRWYFYFVKYALKFSKLEYHTFLICKK